MRIFHRRHNRQSGSSLIEMLIAMVVLTVGLIGSMALVGVAISGDYRSKSDSTSTALAQMVAQKISTVPVCTGACGAVAAVTVQDCTGNVRAINVTGTAGGSGANLTASGKIDYTQAFAGVPAGYAMQYQECGVTNGTRATYDVRWNIQTISNGGVRPAEFVVVAAQLLNSNKENSTAYAPAVNIRTIVGNDGN